MYGTKLHLHHCISGCQHKEGLARMLHRHNSVVRLVFELLTDPSFRPQSSYERAWTDLTGSKALREVFSDWPSMSQYDNHLSATSVADPDLSRGHWQRPDILIERDHRKTLEIIEVACAYENDNLSSIDRKYEEKEAKYADFIANLKSTNTYEVINLKVVVIGARGYVPARFTRDMESLLPNDPDRSVVIHKLAVDCALAAAKGSLRLVTGFLDDKWTPPTVIMPERRFAQRSAASAHRLGNSSTFTSAASNSTMSHASVQPVDVDPLGQDVSNSLSSVRFEVSR